MKILLLIFCLLSPSFVFAHEGHGSSNVIAHGIDHSLWYLSALMIAVAIAELYRIFAKK